MSREFPVLVRVFIYTTSMRLVSLYGRLHIQYPELMMLHDDQYDDYDGDDNDAESSCDMVKAAPFVSALDNNRFRLQFCCPDVPMSPFPGCILVGLGNMLYSSSSVPCCLAGFFLEVSMYTVTLCVPFAYPRSLLRLINDSSSVV